MTLEIVESSTYYAIIMYNNSTIKKCAEMVGTLKVEGGMRYVHLEGYG